MVLNCSYGRECGQGCGCCDYWYRGCREVHCGCCDVKFLCVCNLRLTLLRPRCGLMRSECNLIWLRYGYVAAVCCFLKSHRNCDCSGAGNRNIFKPWPHDVVEATLYRGSDESKFVTRHNLVIDGGFTVKNDGFCVFGQSLWNDCLLFYN